MTVIDVIERKKRGGVLSREEIEFFVDGYVTGDIRDYQAAALLMAVWIRGMSGRETADLTLAMARSGEQVDLSGIPGTKVDKHSTGGVADTTTLVAGPIVAACGGTVAKMSGRGLGHTGGTLDKLESIPGLSVSLDMDEFRGVVRRCGISVVGQTADLVPADKMLYALRDVTATIDNTSLIASSIMSKKLACGADAIVLDVKTGSGAFMEQLDEALELAEIMVGIGRRAGKRTTALVTDMNQPLGNAVGNALEVGEAIDILSGKSSGDLYEVSISLAAEMLVLAGKAPDTDGALKVVRSVVADGRALQCMRCMIEAQGGDGRVVEDMSLLPSAERTIPVPAEASGYVSSIDAEAVGRAAQLLGAGRTRKEDCVDPAVGVVMKRRIGDRIAAGESIGVLHVNVSDRADEAAETLRNAVSVSTERPETPTLIYKRVCSEQ